MAPSPNIVIREISLTTLLGEVCSTYSVDPGLAHLQRYRRDCDDKFKSHIVIFYFEKVYPLNIFDIYYPKVSIYFLNL